MNKLSKINIYVKGQYVCSTNRPTLKLAKELFLAKPVWATMINNTLEVDTVKIDNPDDVKCEWAD